MSAPESSIQIGGTFVPREGCQQIYQPVREIRLRDTVEVEVPTVRVLPLLGAFSGGLAVALVFLVVVIWLKGTANRPSLLCKLGRHDSGEFAPDWEPGKNHVVDKTLIFRDEHDNQIHRVYSRCNRCRHHFRNGSVAKK